MFRGWVQNQYENIGFSQDNVALNSETSRKQNLGSQMKLEQGLRDGNKVKDSIKTRPRYVVEHAYLSVQPLNTNEYTQYQDFHSFLSFCSQHGYSGALPPVRSLKWGSSGFLSTQM